MSPRGAWMFDPNSGGIKISPTVQADVEKRIRAIAEKEFKGKYTRLEIRFRVVVKSKVGLGNGLVILPDSASIICRN